MLLGAVGTLVWDRIWHPTGRGVREQWGGAVYSLSALSASCPAGWWVQPILKVGADRAQSALARVGGLPNLVLGYGVQIVPEASNQVELRYQDSAHRCELLTGGVPPLSWDDLAPLVPVVDALYVNFISGFEMELETAELLRRHFSGPIYADLHSLFLGPPGSAPRSPRPLPEWQRWLKCFDVVQLNERELALLLGGDGADPAQLLGFGPSLVLVTLGAMGARFAARGPRLGDRTHRTLLSRSLPSPDAGMVAVPDGPLEGDPTGCGDVWGSVMCTGLLAGLSVRAAIERANRCAATKILNPDTDRLHLTLQAALSG